MKWPASLRTRLALSSTMGLGMLWLITALLTEAIVHRAMDVVFDSALEETAQRLLPLAAIDIISREQAGISQRIPALREHQEFYTYLVRDAQGRVVMQSTDAQEELFPAFDGLGFRQTDTHRIYFDTALQGQIHIAVAEPMNHRREAARRILASMGLPLLGLVPLSFLGVWMLVWWSLRPVTNLGEAISVRDASDLRALEDPGLPTEITPLVTAVNTLMERLRRALEAERTFTANAAHELRTPVAAALAQTQRLATETSDPGAQQRVRDIESALKRLGRLTEKLLQLARAEGACLRSETRIDLCMVLRMVIDEFSRGPGKWRLKSSMPDESLWSHIDADAFAIVCRNLLENAFRHGDQETPVQICLDAQGLLSVSNDGPPVPEDTLSRLGHSFERGTVNREGTGLGLSIVQAIATGIGGRLRLQSPLPGSERGFMAIFHFPVVAGEMKPAGTVSTPQGAFRT